MLRAVLTLAFIVAMAGRLLGQAAPSARDASPLVGDWELDLDRTHYGPGVDRRRRERMTCTALAERTRCVIRSVRSDGRALTGQFTAGPDGVAAPVTGIPDIDEVRLRRPSASLVDATFFWRGGAVFGYRAYQSADGRSLMILSVDPVTRAPGTTVVVYDRRETLGHRM